MHFLDIYICSCDFVYDRVDPVENLVSKLHKHNIDSKPILDPFSLNPLLTVTTGIHVVQTWFFSVSLAICKPLITPMVESLTIIEVFE